MNDSAEVLREAISEIIAEIIRSCDDGKYCLYTSKKDRKTGKRRRLGTHDSKAAAEKQEFAIKSRGS